MGIMKHTWAYHYDLSNFDCNYNDDFSFVKDINPPCADWPAFVYLNLDSQSEHFFPGSCSGSGLGSGSVFFSETHEL